MAHSQSPLLPTSGIELEPGMPVCQTDLPLDWYQSEFRPYAEEYLALPDRTPETVLPWLDRYVRPALDHFGDSLLLLAHFYMGGEIVKLVERYGGAIADSYALALQAARNPGKKVIVESAVHFMAEAVAILAHDDQQVWITNPKAGCTMEMLAKDHMVYPVADQLIERYGDDLLVIAYMNTSGRLKALAGSTGGAVCTSSNAHLVVDWARQQGKKILFVPDQHLGRNTAWKLGMDLERLVTLPNPQIYGGGYSLDDGTIAGGIPALDRAEMILWGSYCGVHTIFSADMVRWWQERGYRVLVHPESPLEAVQAADGAGSTAYLWKAAMEAPKGSKLVIGTEGHFVRNAAHEAQKRGVEIHHLADIPDPSFGTSGCGCATMSRNDPPHLAGMLDLLRLGKGPDINRVLAGDNVDERTGRRDRLEGRERSELIEHAKASLERMIAITEAGD
ncbi:MAG: quinolinate synthase NadA [Planctomycetes bacterium]|nr:quinolinate synthase NadA [Planctomycetota bacterium]MCB9909440.1 quinolinate synthase NadA [Planctomycetota bacterium]